MSAYTDALDRLGGFYNNGNYSATTNPGGFANDGHRVNFVNSLADVATAGEGISDIALAVAASQAAAAASASSASGFATAADASKTAAAGSASSASTSASTATTKASEAAASALAAAGSATTASTQAGIATTKAGEASTSASTASSAATSATTKASEALTSAGTATTKAAEAAASAVTAAAAAAQLIGSSTTSTAVGTGTKVFTTQSSKFFGVGTDLLITSDANPTTNFMLGRVTAYSGTSLTVDVSQSFGSGSFSDWTIRVSGAPGRIGTNGWTPVFAVVPDSARRVQQVLDWTGGTGTKPATGVYVSDTGFTGTIALATDIRGAAGAGSGDVQTTGAVATNDIAGFADTTGDLLKSLGPMPTLASLGGQAQDALLDAIAALTTANNKGLYFTGVNTVAMYDQTALARTFMAAATANAAQQAIDVEVGVDVQAFNALLAAIAGLTGAANKLPYFTGTSTAATTDLSAYARTLLDDADATAAQTTLGLGSAALRADSYFALASHTHTVSQLSDASANARTFLQAADYGAMRTALGVAIGSNVQAYDAKLAAIVGATWAADKILYTSGTNTIAVADFPSQARTLLAATTAALQRSALGLATVASSGSAADLGSGTLPDARLSSAATPYGKQNVPVPAGAMYARTTNGAASGTVETTTNKVMLKTWDFDTSTQEFVQFAIRMPKSWNEGTVTFSYQWKHAATTTNFGVAFSAAGGAFSNDDAMDTAFGTAVVVTDTGGTTNDMYESAESSAITIAGSPAAGDWVIFQIARVPSDGGDTMAIDAGLLGIILNITTDAGNDA